MLSSGQNTFVVAYHWRDELHLYFLRHEGKIDFRDTEVICAEIDKAS